MLTYYVSIYLFTFYCIIQMSLLYNTHARGGSGGLDLVPAESLIPQPDPSHIGA